MAANGTKDVSFAVRMRGARLSAQQFDVLIHFMRKHPTLALGRAAGGSYCKEEHDFLWKSLTTLLNQTEGPAKSISKWQKCWVDLKSNARSRAAKVRASCVDGVIPAGATFTQWDEHVLTLLGEINPNESLLVHIDAQKSPSQLVEVPLTSGKVVLMEMNGIRETNGGRCRTKKSNVSSISSKSVNQPHNDFYEKQNIKVEETEEDNFHFIEEVHGVEEEDSSGFIHSMAEEEDFDKNDQDHVPSREPDHDEFLLCPTLPPIENSDGINPLSGCSPTRNDGSSIPHRENDNLLSRGRPKKRKQSAASLCNEVEDSIEGFSNKICAVLERVATAAEESNALQRGMVSALDRLSSSLEQLVPILVKEVTKNSNSLQ